MSDLEILGFPQSPFVWLTRIACTEKGVPYRLVPTMPHTPAIDAIHPFGKMPAMRHGGVMLCESRAICLYVDRAFSGPPLVPADPLAAAHVEQWLSLVNTHIDPVLIDRYLVGYLFPGTADGSPNRALIDAALTEMPPIFAALDRAVAETGHLVGDWFTLADMSLLPVLFYMNKFPESRQMLAGAQHLSAYFERHLRRSSVQATLPPPLPSGAAAAEMPAAYALSVA